MRSQNITKVAKIVLSVIKDSILVNKFVETALQVTDLDKEAIKDGLKELIDRKLVKVKKIINDEFYVISDKVNYKLFDEDTLRKMENFHEFIEGK